MKTTKKELKEVDKTEDIICNKCEKSLKDKYNMNFEGLTNAYIRGGFGSKLGDCVDYSFDLCEDCLIELFDSFRIDPLLQHE